MPKADISWKRRTEEGPVQVYARSVGSQWRFYARARRYDRWELVTDPPLEDWLALLDAVERRAARRLQRPEAVTQLRATIQSRFPDWQE